MRKYEHNRKLFSNIKGVVFLQLPVKYPQFPAVLIGQTGTIVRRIRGHDIK